jgi:hypothetical protein
MNKLDTFQNFIASQSMKIPIFDFLLNLIIASLLAILLSKFYVRYGKSLSNRKSFAGNYLLMTMVTMLIISIVKSSLALSLGLVGALSIVRFRAAIKEPEELMYLFFAIAIGLGFGADQGVITVVAFFVILIAILARDKYSDVSHHDSNLFLTIASDEPHTMDIDSVVSVLAKHCSLVNLKRYDESDSIFELTFQVEMEGYEKLNVCKNELQQLGNSIDITFLDNKGIT